MLGRECCQVRSGDASRSFNEYAYKGMMQAVDELLLGS